MATTSTLVDGNHDGNQVAFYFIIKMLNGYKVGAHWSPLKLFHTREKMFQISEIQKLMECRERNFCHKLLRNWSEDTKAKWFCFLKFKCSVKCNCYSNKGFCITCSYFSIWLFIYFYVLLSHVCFCSGQSLSFSFYAFLATSPQREILILKEFLFK